MDRTLLEVIAELAIPIEQGPVDSQDGHRRWALYRQSIEAGEGHDLLLQAVALEPDPSIALSIVLRMIEEVPAGDRLVWISNLAGIKDKEYAMNRAADLGILESSIATGFAISASSSTPNEWSDWLQLRLADSSNDLAVLNLLGERGRTKRIRRAAADRMRTLASP